MQKRVSNREALSASTAPRPTQGHSPVPSRQAEIEKRLRARPSFYASLSPEQRALLEGYDGPEVLGPPPPPPMPRRPRRRGEP